MEGFKYHFNETVLTVWSAPNYCYRCGNVAAILELDETLNKDFTIFEAAPQVSFHSFVESNNFFVFCVAGKSRRAGKETATRLLSLITSGLFMN